MLAELAWSIYPETLQFIKNLPNADKAEAFYLFMYLFGQGDIIDI